MATMPTAQRIVDALRAEGLTVIETTGWRDACRCHTGKHSTGTGPTGRAFGPWHGVTVHHTAGPAFSGAKAMSYSDAGGWLRTGPASAPGPLCLSSIDADGIVYMVGAGRANHAGSVSSKSIEMMKAASFPLTGSTNVRGSDADGNAVTLGVEIMAPGMPSEKQRAAAVKWAAALCRIAGWDGGEVHGHGEVSSSRDFSDPGLDMGLFRRDVRARLASKPATPAPAPAPAPSTPVPTTPKEPTMSLTDDDVQRVVRGVLAAPLGRQTIKRPDGTETPYTLGMAIQDTANRLSALTDRLTVLGLRSEPKDGAQ